MPERSVEFRFTAITFIFLVGVALGAEVIRRMWPHRSGPGGRALIGMLASAGWWCLSVAVEAGTVTVASKVFWSQASYVGIVACSVLFLVFALRFSDLERILVLPIRVLLFLLPAASLALVWTNDWHGLVWTGYAPAREANMITYVHGPAFWAIIGWIYFFVMASTFILMNTALRMRGIHRFQAIVVLVAMPIPWVTSLLYVTGHSPLASVDFTPLAMSLSGVVLALAVLRLQLIDLMPIAHERIFEALEDGLLVLDPRDRIVEANHAVHTLLDLQSRGILGRRLDEVSRTLEEFLPAEGRVEIRVGEPPRDIEVHVLPLERPMHDALGRLVVLRDVTARKRAEDQLAVRQHEMEVLATTDSLTGLFNRRHADDTLAAEVRRSRRYGTPLSVALVDIDHFKAINDRYGHESGDGALRHITHVLLCGSRSTDVVCRFGGEEFLILLPHTGPGEAFQVMDRLRQQMEELPEPTTGERMTFSVGIASWRDDRDAFEILREADARLYRAKQEGRNRVIGEEGLQA